MQAKSKNQSYQQIEGPDQKVREQIKKLNLRILQKSFPYICSILVTLQYGVQARYNIEAKFWSYLKIKGPVFLAEDKYKRMEIIIMNQCEIENSTIKIPQGTKFQLKQLQNGYLLSCLKHDSQTGYIIQAIWTADNRVQEMVQKVSEIICALDKLYVISWTSNILKSHSLYYHSKKFVQVEFFQQRTLYSQENQELNSTQLGVRDFLGALNIITRKLFYYSQSFYFLTGVLQPSIQSLSSYLVFLQLVFLSFSVISFSSPPKQVYLCQNQFSIFLVRCELQLIQDQTRLSIP